ncbi:MAG: ABC transporter ATP-binding protein [Candidatus Pacebacteria bacterium]|nr:ABC transporter ATP-binding protein [Candidatus Paceibacterota bacterium]
MFNINIKLRVNQFKEILNIGWTLFDGYRKYMVVLFFLGILSSFASALGINALIPVFSFFIKGGEASAGTDVISRFIKDSFLFAGIPFSLVSVLILISILFIIKAGVLYLSDYIRIHIKTRYQQDMMDKVFKKSLRADWSYLMKQKIGYLETVIRTDVAVSTGVIDLLASLLIVGINLLVYIIVALNISQTITLMTISLGLILILVLKPLFGLTKKYSKQIASLNKKVAQHINEHISGIKTVKASGVEGEVGSIGGELFRKFRFLQIKTFLTQRVSGIITEPVGVIFISCVVAFAYYQTAYNLGALIAVVYLIRQIFSFIQNILSSFHSLSGSIPYVREVLKYQEMATQFEEKKMENGEDNFSFKDSLKIKNVSFEYESGKKAIKKINLEIKKGEMVGFIGPSGGGKSTLFDLLLRFFNPTEGEILLDNKNIKEISIKDWRKNVAYVPQDIFLLNDTIRENIKFRNKKISEEDIIEAAKSAYIYNFIKELPEGLNTVVGERGLMLSGGQKQRIVVARALAKKPQIILLDEATSALDSESEKIIQKVFEEKDKKITILTIAHRLSTVRNVDKLFVIENGQIIESGKPDKLLEQKGTYFSKVYNMKI